MRASPFARVLATVFAEIDRKAEQAKAEIHAMAVRDRRSMGQRVRWINHRMAKEGI